MTAACCLSVVLRNLLCQEGIKSAASTLPRGFVYLIDVIDWATRKVLAWRLSITLETLAEAMTKYGKPQIMNTDQGNQFWP